MPDAISISVFSLAFLDNSKYVLVACKATMYEPSKINCDTDKPAVML